MYDVVVVGAGTAGCSAAYIAAKYGLKTLLVEKKIHAGGSITSGLVVPVMNAGVSQINREFYSELVQEMSQCGAQIDFDGNNGWFNPEIMKIVLDKMLKSVGVEIRFSTSVYSAELNSSQNITKLFLQNELLSESINKIYSNNPSLLIDMDAPSLLEYINEIDDNNNCSDNCRLLEPIETRYVVDATGNCDVGKICGCKIFEDGIQPLSLRFIMGGVDTEKFAEFLEKTDNDRNVSPIFEIGGDKHFSTAYTWDSDRNWALRSCFEQAVRAGDLTVEDTNYFQIFTVAGCRGAVAFNCPRILKTPDLSDTKAVSEALTAARVSILRLSEFCKKYFPGFENSYVSNIADDLGIRVSRRISGRYFYTEQDLREGKSFDNPVLEADYPIDIHSEKKDCSTLKKVGKYSLPIESLMSAEVGNLFVAGRCLSADFAAQAALRVQQSCFSMGEAVAKYIRSLIS